MGGPQSCVDTGTENMSAQLLLLLTSLHLGQGVSVSVSVEEAELTNNFGDTSTMSESKQLFSPKMGE